VMIDLLSDDPIGVHALNYTITALFLFRFRKYFLYDHPLHLSLFTILVSFCSTLLQLFLLFLFDRRIPFTGQWAFGDLLAMPLADALYALVWFALPLRGYLHICRRPPMLYKKGSIYWLKLKKRFFPTSL
jgi:cell shape-determining protein MreD